MEKKKDSQEPSCASIYLMEKKAWKGSRADFLRYQAERSMRKISQTANIVPTEIYKKMHPEEFQEEE